MKVIVLDNYQQISIKAAQIVASQIILKEDSILGLATGGTPVGMYSELVKMYKLGIIDFKKIKTFNLDEYVGLSKENQQSYYYYMMDNLFKHVNINIENIDIPNGMADIKEECVRYENEIKQSGGIDLQVLGIGHNGHIGFNEPDIKFESVTHLVKLDEDTIKANSRFFDSVDEVPKQALSMGIKTIMHSKKIVLIASGKEKAKAIYGTVKGNITPNLPASILQLHNDVYIIADKEAASLL
ncbi:MAG TPA: glucosamine-6-phosphate deaminase [Tepiditoga sp.]|nr:glucosamine-6-phosphate deaminase [Thermotogota bacterium]HOO73796.1 glucosamine-6-phosphate deaminase [Tepiditoga sp.]